MKRLFLFCYMVLCCVGCDATSDGGETGTDSSAAFIRCETNFDCPESMPFCADNRCVACKADGDCHLGALCRAGECIPCNTDDHCGESCGACPENSPYCTDAGDGCGTCNALHPCAERERCSNGTCELCNTAEHCGDACETCEGFTPYCNDEATACGDCNSEHPCDEGQWCDGGVCTACNSNEHCGDLCEDCTGSFTPVCSQSQLRCVECDNHLDCGGTPAVCTFDKTCTCEAASPSDPRASCTDDNQCPNADYVCAQDWASPEHWACLRICDTASPFINGLSCQSLPTVSGGNELVWAPPTTCYAYYQARLEADCEIPGDECSALTSSNADSRCTRDAGGSSSTCSYGCTQDNQCSPAMPYCFQDYCSTIN